MIARSECGKAHGPDWERWLEHLKDKPGAMGLELGTWKGESAEWMLENIFTSLNSQYWCVDTFQGNVEHHLGGHDCSTLEKETRARLERFSPRAQIFKGRTDQTMKGFLRDDRFDFIYVDASHDALNVLRDSVLAFDLLKVGGIMTWDDYEWEVYPEAIDRPKMAIDSFLSCYARHVEVLHKAWQVAVRKVA